MTYTPDPIRTDGIEIPDDLVDLCERLAAHVHDVWAQERFDNGWTFGHQRNDGLKTNPCLVAFDSLAEKEKDVDRVVVGGLIRAIIQLGFRIERTELSEPLTTLPNSGADRSVQDAV